MNKQEALEYLANARLHRRTEWVEAAMYSFMCRVINSDREEFAKEELDEYIEEAEQS